MKSNQDYEAIRKMSKNELAKYAETKSKEILSLIYQSCEKVRVAKDDSKNAESMKIGLFSRSKAKTDAVASALLRTNEAVAELAKLQKEVITFTCVSVEFARVMHETMAKMMVGEFRDTNGNLRKLDKNTQEFAQHILDEADRFVKKQQAVENELNRQAESINAVAKVAEDNRKRLIEKDDLDKVHDRRLDAKDAKDIEHDKRLSAKDVKDVEHDRRLNEKDEIDKKHDERLDAKDTKDVEHDRRLDDLAKRLKEIESITIPLWMKITVIISFVLSVISIFLSLAKF